MKKHLTRLIEHMNWADNTHWKMFNSDEKYLQDKLLFEKLFHIHFVQLAFLNIVTNTIGKKTPNWFYPEIFIWNGNHNRDKLLDFVKNLGESDLEERFMIPWFRDAVDGFPLSDCLNQVAMHSHYHRASKRNPFQGTWRNTTMTDFIWWAFQSKKDKTTNYLNKVMFFK